MVHFGEFLKPEAWGQIVLPDRSVLIGQKLVETTCATKYRSKTVLALIWDGTNAHCMTIERLQYPTSIIFAWHRVCYVV